MSTHEFGKELENDVVNALNKIGINARRTKGSGNKGQLGDIQNDYFVVECKNRNTKDITIKADVWKKLKSEIPLHSKRLPIYVLRNKNQDTLAVMDLSDLLYILNMIDEEKLQ